LCLGVVCRVNQDGVAKEHQSGNDEDEDPIWLVEDVRNKLDAWDNQEGWKCDPVEDSQNTEESKGNAGANLHMIFIVSNTVDEDKAPEDNERFDAVGERVRLEGPGNVGRRN
jgi:hypothetical protein